MAQVEEQIQEQIQEEQIQEERNIKLGRKPKYSTDEERKRAKAIQTKASTKKISAQLREIKSRMCPQQLKINHYLQHVVLSTTMADDLWNLLNPSIESTDSTSTDA
jgi:hypothetical protein